MCNNYSESFIFLLEHCYLLYFSVVVVVVFVFSFVQQRNFIQKIKKGFYRITHVLEFISDGSNRLIAPTKRTN